MLYFPQEMGGGDIMSKRILKSLSLCFALCLLLSCCPGCTLLLSSERTWPFGAKETPEVGDATAPPGEDGPTGETAACQEEHGLQFVWKHGLQ